MNANGEGRIVVGVANTLAGYQALRYAVDQARQRGLRLIAVHSFEYAHPESWEWRTAMAEQALAEMEGAFVEALGGWPDDLEIDRVIEPGPPGRLLAATADRSEDSLVIGGSSQRSRLYWRPTATTLKLCSRLTVCPVTVVPEPSLARAGSAHHRGGAIARDAERFLRERAHSG